MREGIGTAPTLDEIIANPAIHADGDVDLYLKIPCGKAHPVQITRLEEHYTGRDCSEGLLSLIGRKARRSEDKDMILVVIGDVNGLIDLEKVRTGLEATPCPFGYIFLVGIFGEYNEEGRYTSQMVYPQLRQATEIKLGC